MRKKEAKPHDPTPSISIYEILNPILSCIYSAILVGVVASSDVEMFYLLSIFLPQFFFSKDFRSFRLFSGN